MNNITREHVEFCLSLEAKYLKEAAEFEKKAWTCEPKSRGAYRSHAAQRRKSATRMRANYDAQMGWLVENNFELYLEMKEAARDETN